MPHRLGLGLGLGAGLCCDATAHDGVDYLNLHDPGSRYSGSRSLVHTRHQGQGGGSYDIRLCDRTEADQVQQRLGLGLGGLTMCSRGYG